MGPPPKPVPGPGEPVPNPLGSQVRPSADGFLPGSHFNGTTSTGRDLRPPQASEPAANAASSNEEAIFDAIIKTIR